MAQLLIRLMAPGEIPHGHYKTLDQAVLAQVAVRGLDQHLALIRPLQRAVHHPVAVVVQRAADLPPIVRVDQILQRHAEVIDKLRRVLFKSVGSLVCFQERVGEKWKARCAAGPIKSLGDAAPRAERLQPA